MGYFLLGPQHVADAITLYILRGVVVSGAVMLVVGGISARFSAPLAAIFVGVSVGAIVFSPTPPSPRVASVVLHIAVPPEVAGRLAPGASATVVDRAASGVRSWTAACGAGCTFTVDAPSGANDFDVTLAGIGTGRIAAAVNAGSPNHISATFGSTVASVRLPHLFTAAGTAATFDASPTAFAPDGSIVLVAQPWRDARGRALTLALEQAGSSGGTTLRALHPEDAGGAEDRYEFTYDGSAHSTCILHATMSAGMSVGDGSFASLSADAGSYGSFVKQTVAITDGPDKTFWVIADNSIVRVPIDPARINLTRNAYTTPVVVPQGVVAAGSDGNVWITLSGRVNAVERVGFNYSGTAFTDRRFRALRGIAAGPDGNLWVADRDNSSIDRVTRSGKVTVYSTAPKGPSNREEPDRIAFGSDGKLYYTNDALGEIGALDIKSGKHVEFALPRGAAATDLALGADGDMWYIGVDAQGGIAGRLAPSGTSQFFALGAGVDPTSIVEGADGNIWFSDRSFGLRWITLSGQMGIYPIGGLAGGIAALYASFDGSFWVRTFPQNGQVAVHRYRF